MKRLLAILVTVGILVTATGFTAGATVSDNDMILGEAEFSEPAEVIEEEVLGATYIAQGTGDGYAWKISDTGKLIITGIEGKKAILPSSYRAPWKDYADQIVSLKLTADKVEFAGSLFPAKSKLKTVVFEVGEASGSMSWMFSDCSDLKTVDLSRIDTRNVTDMSNMFRDCSDLKTVDLSSINTRNVKDMSYMFRGCESLETLDLSSFHTENVKAMNGMFFGCSSLKTLNISFDTRNVTEMSEMFMDCKALEAIDLRSFWTSQVTVMDNMFSGCASLKQIDASHFDTSSVKDMVGMFSGCSALTELKMTGWKTDKLQYMRKMFKDCASLESLSIEFVTDKVSTMESLFEGCKKLTYLDVSKINTDSVVYMANMFKNCESLQKLDVTHFNTERVQNMADMFFGCNSLQELDVTRFNTNQVTDMWGMFCGCKGLKTLDVDSFQTANVTKMGSMFSGCEALSEIHLNCFQTEKVENMSYMFKNCASLTVLDLSSFSMSNVKKNNMCGMFEGCTKLENLNIQNFSFENVWASGTRDLLEECSALKSIRVPKGVTIDIKLPEIIGCDWYSKSEGIVTSIPKNLSQPDLLVTLKKTYTISYHENATNVENMPASQDKLHGETLVLSKKKPTRTGYNFMCWCERSNGFGTKYDPGSEYTQNANEDLYAIWEVKTYNVTYDANGGSFFGSDQKKNYGEELYLSDRKPWRTGYQFVEWNTAADGSGTAYAAGSIYKKNANLYLYAQWEKETYVISYNGNGGTNVPDNQMKLYEEDLYLSSIIPTRTGYNFMYWCEKSNGFGTKYDPNSKYIGNENKVLYAIWEAKTYAVIYDANGGNEGPKDQKKTYGEDLNLTVNIPRRTGYYFVEWNTAADGSGTAYARGDVYKRNAKVVLYAQWKAQTFTVTYEANGGENAPAPQTKTYDIELTLSSKVPTRTGYSFLGWNTELNGNEINYEAGAIYKTNASVYLYAQWKPKTYTITFDANGGNNAPAAQTKTYGQELTLSTKMPARTYYNFLGWNTMADGTGTTYKAGAVLKRNGNITLYAQWQEYPFIISYDANGGSGAPAEVKKDYGQTVTISSQIPNRTKYVFVGWNTQADGKGKAYKAGASYGEDASLELYAQWKYAEYSVGYDANGGNGAPATQEKFLNQDLTLSSQKPVRQGYTFVNWNTKADGSGTAYLPGATYAKNVTVLLYAQWKRITYGVSYNANGGVNAPASQTKVYGQDLVLSSEKPSRTGYTFTGWNTKEDGTGTAYAVGVTYKENAKLVLYAQWKVNTYAVSYDANGGTSAPGAQTKTYGKELTLSSTKPSRTGYTFTGWNTLTDGTGTAYASGAVYKKNAKLTLYAQWKVNTYAVSYDANGGEEAPGKQTKTYGKDLTLSSEKPSRSGYSFTGWNTQADGKGTAYAAGSVYKENAKVTLYAQWKVNTYAVSYDANGGEKAPGKQTKTYGKDLTLSSEKPSRSGYSFTGWNTQADGKGTAYAAGAVYKENAKLTLYAQWKVITYAVSYDANGGTSAPGAQTKTYGKELTLSSTKPSRTGYTFTGWNTLADGKGTAYAAGAVYKENAKLTLYAQWKVLKCSVSYNANGGSKAPATQEKVMKKDLTLSSEKPVREGYTFVSWNTMADGAGTAYQPGAVYTKDTAMVLYAQWKVNTYAVSYDANGGEKAPGKQTKTYGKDLTLSSEKPSRSGYSFTGWNTKADGSGTAYAAGATYKANAKLTLYAQWKKIEVTNIFADVDMSSWQYAPAKYVYDRKIMAGKGVNSANKIIFAPNDSITRGEFATVLYNMEGRPEVTYQKIFLDVPDAMWYSKPIIWAYNKKVAVGYGANFGVANPITREQLAQMLYSFAKSKNYNVQSNNTALNNFKDKGKVSSWAMEAMNWAVTQGVMKGKGGGILDPVGTATRAECAAMIQNFLNAMGK